MDEFDKDFFEKCVAKVMANIDTEDYGIDLVQEVYGVDGVVAEVLDLAICCIEANEEINAKNLLSHLNYELSFISKEMIEEWFDGYCIMLVDM